jgi:hypothetical protein
MVSETISIVLESRSREVLKLKHGIYKFRVRLVDLVNEFVEVYRCVTNTCKCIHFDVTDFHGTITFEDKIEGLSTIVYRFLYTNGVYAELHVIPIAIDAEEIIRKVVDLTTTILTLGGLRIK